MNQLLAFELYNIFIKLVLGTMARYFIFFFCCALIRLNCYGQINLNSCTVSTIVPDSVFYPMTTTTYTDNIMSWTALYLCGTNTIVYDTLQINKCRIVLLEPGTMYVTKSLNCGPINFFYAKATSTVIIQAGSSTNPNFFTIYYETGATIINLAGSSNLNLCSSLSFPNINCSVGIKEIKESPVLVTIYPQPAGNSLYLEVKNYYQNAINVNIFDVNGRELYNEQILLKNGKSQVPLYLESGLYILQIRTPENYIIRQKVIISN